MFANLKSTKGNKKTEFTMPKKLKSILLLWKIEQEKELACIDIKQDDNQYLFTYEDRKGNLNRPVHINYLNYRMNSIRKRHPELVKCSPHKLRHTSATIAKQRGMSLEKISEALTHSDIVTTKTYVNSDNVVILTPADFVYNQLVKKGVGNRWGIGGDFGGD